MTPCVVQLSLGVRLTSGLIHYRSSFWEIKMGKGGHGTGSNGAGGQRGGGGGGGSGGGTGTRGK